MFYREARISVARPSKLIRFAQDCDKKMAESMCPFCEPAEA
jgi:hypothetical protein